MEWKDKPVKRAQGEQSLQKVRAAGSGWAGLPKAPSKHLVMSWRWLRTQKTWWGRGCLQNFPSKQIASRKSERNTPGGFLWSLWRPAERFPWKSRRAKLAAARTQQDVQILLSSDHVSYVLLKPNGDASFPKKNSWWRLMGSGHQRRFSVKFGGQVNENVQNLQPFSYFIAQELQLFTFNYKIRLN